MRRRPAQLLSGYLNIVTLVLLLSEAVKPVIGATSTHSVDTPYALHGAAFLNKHESQTSLRYGSMDEDVPAVSQVVRTPVTQDSPDEHVLEEREGRIHTKEHTFWPPDQGNGLVAWIFASLFILLIASVPGVLHLCRVNAKFSWVLLFEGFALLGWLVCGLLCFTQLVEFQSPHFGSDIRTLTLVEAVYLFAQILTTVGYGDITPAHAGGQAIVACFVLVAIILIAELISELSTIVLERAEKHVAEVIEQVSARASSSDENRPGPKGPVEDRSMPALRGVLISTLLFCIMVLIGTCFFHLYPGEGKTWGQGVYMSIITLTTVGFGAFTAETEGGKVFGSFWMVLGVVSLGYVVTSFTEYMMVLREKDDQHKKQYEQAAEDLLHMECVDHHGRVDQLGYLRYALLRYHLVPKDEIDGILRQFQALDRDHRGTVSVEVVKQLSLSPTARGHAHHGHHGLHMVDHHSPGSEHR